MIAINIDSTEMQFNASQTQNMIQATLQHLSAKYRIFLNLQFDYFLILSEQLLLLFVI